MTNASSNKLTLIALILLGIVGIVCVMLGQWQLERAAERKHIAETLDAGRRASPLVLSPNLSTDEVKAWQPATASGLWRSEWSVLLDNRNFEGRPGLWLASPLMLDRDTAVLVLRGWVERPIGNRPVKKIPSALTTVQINGELAMRVPRLFELWTSEANTGATLPQDWKGTQWPLDGDIDPLLLPRLQNLDLDLYAKRTGLKFLPFVLMQQAEESQSGLQYAWPEPSIDFDKNFGYAMQWFGFAGIVGIAFLVVIWRRVRARQSP